MRWNVRKKNPEKSKWWKAVTFIETSPRMIIIHALNLRDTKRSLTNVSSIPALLNQILLAMGNGNDEKTWPLTTISSLTLTILHSLTFFHGPAGGLFFFFFFKRKRSKRKGRPSSQDASHVPRLKRNFSQKYFCFWQIKWWRCVFLGEK